MTRRLRELLVPIGAVMCTVGCGSSASIQTPYPSDASIGVLTAPSAPAGNVAVGAKVILVEESPFRCPAIAGISINPAALAPGQAAQLGVTTTGATPPASYIRWMVIPASGGRLTDAGSPSPGFFCNDAGVVTVGVQVGLTEPNVGNICAGVADSWQAETIVCEAPR